MTACMFGSGLSGVLLQRSGGRPQRYMAPLYAVAFVALLVPAVANLPSTAFASAFHQQLRPVGSTELTTEAAALLLSADGLGETTTRGGLGASGHAQLLAFCVFEACLGVFWPSMQVRAAMCLRC
jgi:MFS transporter, MFS domain-containing protein family, molybdate-anion transporter